MLQSMRSAAKYIWIFVVVAFVGVFLFTETSGLLGTAPVTTGTAVAEVNGDDIPYLTWMQAAQQRIQQENEQRGRTLTLDEEEQIRNAVFDELVQSVLLEQEYKRRGIRVTDEEIVQAAQFSPPPQFMQSPELQTDGRFDLEKYQRFLKSATARQQGLYFQLENYYRTEIPRAKLYEQLASQVFVTDDELWQAYRDRYDSARVAFVAFDPASVPDSGITVSDAEIRAYFDRNKAQLERPGRAAVSILSIPRTVSAADSAAVRARALALRDEIVNGTPFEDVAKRESADTISGSQGGSLGRGPKGRFVEAFETAAFALQPGQVSQPVETQFGVHLIKVDAKKADTIDVRHILLRFQQSDSSATRTDRKADSLANIAASQDSPARFDSAAKVLNLSPARGVAIEGEPLTVAGNYVPSVSAWAFSGVKVGETSELFDADGGYVLARLDSLIQGGVPTLEDAREEIRRRLMTTKKLERLEAQAKAFATAAASSTMESAAAAQNLTVTKSEPFARDGFVPGMGRLNQAIGAAFSLPIGAVSAPIRTNDAVIVLRVDQRVDADRKAWEEQKTTQRIQVLQRLRQQRIQAFMQQLRESADIEDNRKQLAAQARQA
ncbi:MAG TPA: peptidyl-prolyl cis-trans isomerase [Gemmatimonadaceae bacterium]|nr:peptidyl-prolyl cis-trans isomerase [Gemmatimonadaceae bacterium]